MHPFWAVYWSAGLFVAMLVCLELGFRAGSRHLRQYPASGLDGVATIEAAVFGLLGLLLAFAFSGGMSRLDARRQLMVQETNAIGTAYLRLDLMSAEELPVMRQMLRDYLDTRVRFYSRLSDPSAATLEQARTAQLQEEIWRRAAAATKDDPSQNVAKVLMPALNEMIDITTSQKVALFTHLPTTIFLLLNAIALMSGVMGGYAMACGKRRDWLHMIVFAATLAVAIYVVFDLDFPRYGLIRLDVADKALMELRKSMQ